jgi:hypothetical protein
VRVPNSARILSARDQGSLLLATNPRRLRRILRAVNASTDLLRCITSFALRKPLDVIPSKVRKANFVEGSRTGSRTRTRYRFLVREALLGYAKVLLLREGLSG